MVSVRQCDFLVIFYQSCSSVWIFSGHILTHFRSYWFSQNYWTELNWTSLVFSISYLFFIYFHLFFLFLKFLELESLSLSLSLSQSFCPNVTSLFPNGRINFFAKLMNCRTSSVKQKTDDCAIKQFKKAIRTVSLEYTVSINRKNFSISENPTSKQVLKLVYGIDITSLNLYSAFLQIRPDTCWWLNLIFWPLFSFNYLFSPKKLHLF